MTAPLRKILHIDMDAFFASVEQRDRPDLRGRPVLVGGDPHGRGVVAAASYEARAFGISSAMTCAEARRRCPEAVFLTPDLRRYLEASRRIHEIFQSVTPLVEPLSLDEAFLDVTVNTLGEPLAREVARHLKARIQGEVGLTASAGAAPNKFVAKVASDLRKPDGLVVVAPARVADFVAGLPVERLWGVGPATATRLHELGARTAADLRAVPVERLVRVLGKTGAVLHDLAHGIDPRLVEPHRELKSRGAETTFPRDVTDPPRLLEELERLAVRVGRGLSRMARAGRTVTLKLRYADFTTITRSRTLPVPTSDSRRIAQTAAALLDSSTEADRRPVRLVGVSVSGLCGEQAPTQLALLAEAA